VCTPHAGPACQADMSLGTLHRARDSQHTHICGDQITAALDPRQLYGPEAYGVANPAVDIWNELRRFDRDLSLSDIICVADALEAAVIQ
jgi:hypothetical protein